MNPNRIGTGQELPRRCPTLPPGCPHPKRYPRPLTGRGYPLPMSIYKELAAAHANLKLGDPVKQLRDFLTLLESPELTDGDKLRFLGEVVAAISDVSVKADLVRMAKRLDDLEAMRRLFLETNGEDPA